MERVSCRGYTSLLMRSVSQPKSSAYRVLAMASLPGWASRELPRGTPATQCPLAAPCPAPAGATGWVPSTKPTPGMQSDPFPSLRHPHPLAAQTPSPHLASTALSTVSGVKIFSRSVSWLGTHEAISRAELSAPRAVVLNPRAPAPLGEIGDPPLPPMHPPLLLVHSPSP